MGGIGGGTAQRTNRRGRQVPAAVLIAAGLLAAGPLAAEPLSIENAKLLTVPTAPRLSVPKTPASPPSFAAPRLVEAPAQPQIAVRPTPGPIAPAATPKLPAEFDATPKAPPKAPATVTEQKPPEQKPEESASPTAPTPAEPPQQIAALPPPAAVVPLPAGPLSIRFVNKDKQIPDSATALLTTLAGHLQSLPTVRLQLRSYAMPTDDPRDARRLSLDRAMAVREKLAALGVRSQRVDVRALGADPSNGAQPDRIDIDVIDK